MASAVPLRKSRRLILLDTRQYFTGISPEMARFE
jgi:hypothetical protein